MMLSILNNKKFLLTCGCFAIFFPGSFVFGFPGVMAAEWQQLFNVDKAQIGQLMFFILAGTGFSMYLSGKLQEKMAPHWMILTGNFFCALCIGLVGYATSITHIYIWAFAEGFFCGFVYIPCLTIFQKVFRNNRGLTTGIINLTFGGSSAVMSPVYSFLLVSKGYWAACLITMITAICIGMGCALFLKVLKPVEEEGLTPLPKLSLTQIITLKPFRYLWCVWALAGAAGVSMIMLSSTFGSMFTVSAPLVTDCFGLENFGRVFGLVFTAYGFLAGFLGPWLSGVILDFTQGSFTIVFIGFSGLDHRFGHAFNP